MLIHPAVLFETPGDTGGGAEPSALDGATPFGGTSEPPAATGEPEGGTPAPEATTPAPEGGTTPPAAPWASDLEARFEDEGVRGQVDAYLRESVQPYVTRLEQGQLTDDQRGFFQELQEQPAQAAISLLDAMYGDESAETVDPGAAILGLIGDVYGEDAVGYFEAAIAFATEEDPQVPGDGPEDEGGEVEYELPPEVQEVLDWAAEQREGSLDAQADAEYVTEVKELLVQNAADFPEGIEAEKAADLLAPFLVAREGDLDAAFEDYKAWKADLAGGRPAEEAAAAASAGLTPEQLAEAEQNGGPPATLPGGASTPPPAQKQYGDLGEAIRDFVREDLGSKTAPPTI